MSNQDLEQPHLVPLQQIPLRRCEEIVEMVIRIANETGIEPALWQSSPPVCRIGRVRIGYTDTGYVSLSQAGGQGPTWNYGDHVPIKEIADDLRNFVTRFSNQPELTGVAT